MTRRSTRAAAVLSVLLLATGCSVDARDEIRGQVEQITLDANGRDVGAVRGGVDELFALLDDAVREGDLTQAEADAIRALAQRVRDNAELLDQPTPTPTPSATTVRPTPTTASPTPEETEEEPEETEEPEPSPEPVETEEPSPTPTPRQTTPPPVVVEPTLSPAAEQQPVSPSPAS